MSHHKRKAGLPMDVRAGKRKAAKYFLSSACQLILFKTALIIYLIMGVYTAMNSLLRFKKDVQYDLLVPPLGVDFASMTPKEAKENFEWFISKIPERMKYLTNRCAQDLRVSVDELGFTPDSLKLIWRWFLKTAKVEKVPKNEIAIMEKNAGHLGESWIIRERLTVVSQFILRDIGMYLGETLIKNYCSIHWGYFMKPQNDVFAKRPVLLGFLYVDPENKNPPSGMPFDPIGILDYEGHKVVSNCQKETDLYDVFRERLRFIPVE